jgi:hypothetical protein
MSFLSFSLGCEKQKNVFLLQINRYKKKIRIDEFKKSRICDGF